MGTDPLRFLTPVPHESEMRQWASEPGSLGPITLLIPGGAVTKSPRGCDNCYAERVAHVYWPTEPPLWGTHEPRRRGRAQTPPA